MSLYVDIEKQCGDFFLKVKLEAADEVMGLLGASGCGKSMTLKCIAGIEKPDRGVIRLGDRVLFDSQQKINLSVQKRRVGYLFQDYALFPNMTVFQNIMCGAKDKDKTMDYIRRFYLEGKENLYPSQLSGGQKQRVAMARMIAGEPEILMLDEPFAALDNYLKMQLERELMKAVEAFGGTVLFVSHDRNEAYRMTDHIAVMEDGHIVEVQEKAKLFSNPHTLAATLLTGCKNISHLTKSADGSAYAQDWGLKLSQKGNDEDAYLGLRAHYFEPVDSMQETDVVECKVLRVIEDTFSAVVLFTNAGCEESGDYSVMAYELSKEEWAKLSMREHLYLRIPLEQAIFLKK